ncbi:MAG: plasmid mobilization relaxosome protein MobC [Parasporobacterium sp.]|nr:plasmid mobilization relaxosome protein MobC [Parasporobacterium sp.]
MRTGKYEKFNDKRFQIRLPHDEFEDWKDAADLLDISIAEYVRQMVRRGRIDFVIKEEVSLQDAREIITEYGRIGNNINQIAHHLNAGYQCSGDLVWMLKEQMDRLDAMHLLLMEAVKKFNGNPKTYRQPKCPLQ